MNVLYKLAFISLTETYNNDSLNIRKWDAYMLDGYNIAKKLPLLHSYSYRNQFLTALSFLSVDYVNEMFKLNEDYRNLPIMAKRKYPSYRTEIMCCSRMLINGNDLSSDELDKWFNRFCELTSKYPYDCQAP